MITIRVSQAGACPRRLQLEAWGVEGAPIWEGTERAFAEGRIHEPDILEWAAQNLPGGPYTVVDRQRELVSNASMLSLVGHIDGLAVNKNLDAYLLEAKCLSARAFQELRERGVMESHPQYYVQVQLYLHLLGRQVKGAYLVARNKETPRNRLWDHHYEEITYNPRFVEKEILKLQDLAHDILKKRDIPKPYNPEKDWQCRPPWCPYTKLCWPEWSRPKAEAIVDDSIADVVEQYQAIGEQISELEQARDELKQKLLASLDGRPVMAGRWVVQKMERRQERFDTQLARKELPADVLARLIKVNTYEQLKIEEAY